MLVSEATLEELDDGLRRPKVARYVSEEQRLEFLAASIRDAEEVVVTTRLRECRDPNDDNMVELSPCEFIDRVADLVPPPRKHRHRCHGVFAPNHRLRKAVTSLAKKGTLASAARTRPAGMQSADASRKAAATPITNPAPTTRQAKAWAKLLARVDEDFPLECPGCGGDIHCLCRHSMPRCGRPARRAV